MLNLSDIRFTDNHIAANRREQYRDIIVHAPTILKSWRLSLFSHEWLGSDGQIKALSALSENEAFKRERIELDIANKRTLIKPVLGIGLLENVEIGSGKAEFLTLAALGLDDIPVHIPQSNYDDFKPYLSSMSDKENPDTSSERGNVLFFILIAVALLGALSFAIANSSRNTNTNLTGERASIAASEILDYTNTVSNAVKQLELRGCRQTEINFVNSVSSTDYTNPNAPTDGSCDVFHLSGGALNYRAPAPEWLETSRSAQPFYSQYIFTGHACIPHVGSGFTSCNTGSERSASAELIMILPHIKQEICALLNEKLNVTNAGQAIPTDSSHAWGSSPQFIGTYTGDNSIYDTGTGVLSGKTAGCFRGDSTPAGGYHFYRVLIAR